VQALQGLVVQPKKRFLLLLGGGCADANAYCDQALESNTSPGPGSRQASQATPLGSPRREAAVGSLPTSQSPSLSPGLLDRLERASDESSPDQNTCKVPLTQITRKVPLTQITPIGTPRGAAVALQPVSPLSPWMLDEMQRLDAETTHTDSANIRWQTAPS
jgi:hypothetical protein